MVLQVCLQPGLCDVGCVGRGSVLLEHVGRLSGNSLHPGLHHGVQDLDVLLEVDPLPLLKEVGGGMTLPLLEMTLLARSTFSTAARVLYAADMFL